MPVIPISHVFLYANKITLISTVEQAGIRNQGQLFASSGNVAIDANGSLVNSGTMAAANVQDMNNTAEHKVNIRSQAFENSGTAVSQQGTQIHSQSIQNTGKLLSAGTEDLAVSGSLNNQNGEIATNQQLIIHDGQQSTVVIDNTNGTIQSGRDVAIQAKSLSNNGTLAADNKLDIALQDDFYVERKIVAGNELSLSTRGSLKIHIPCKQENAFGLKQITLIMQYKATFNPAVRQTLARSTI